MQNTKAYRFTITLMVVVVALIGYNCERKITEQITQEGEASQFVGSAACGACHDVIYDDFTQSGHPYKLNPASVVASGDYYPFSDVPNPPASVSGWDDVSYVIGGYGWKARFIGTDGYIITAGGNNQYNLVDGSWSDYHADETKPYDCGSCHTTGFNSDTTRHQDGLPGIKGEWAFPGIQCEECHGPGGAHIEAPYNFQMTIDRGSGQCGRCHIRGSVGEIPASPTTVNDTRTAFIKHHEQYNEIMASKHASIECVDCHDPHKSAHYNVTGAIKLDCESCHWEAAESFENSEIGHASSDFGPDCVDCHMPKASKSAKAAAIYEGDVHTHLFSINIDADASMFNADTTLANPYLTLEYVCLHCHTGRSKQWAANHADQVHAN